ncbi:MAG TPA: hypothetical protein VGY54_03985 [Polyangiaceae bacterium]|jgi:hypothetical protein|nr:hypothetical protein [Polyangiaceae bacterium]
MNAIIGIPLLIAVVSALVYALASNGKLCELARILFFVGAFWAVWLVCGAHVRLP